ncbi:MAG: ROK family protein [Verrucomicrobiae bacterium]|jgi:predicted NBD/HSP70 family sugar kinase|nr:ROK family protein [Verrucomicrobiae bacterium]
MKSHNPTSPEDFLWGVDIGGTKIEAVITNKNAPEQALYRRRVPTERDGGYTHILNQIRKLVKEMETLSGQRSPDKIGFGTPGVSDPTTGILRNSNTICLNGQRLEHDLSAILGVEALLANDANCFALAETLLGAAQGKEVVMGLILGTGVGGGIVIHGHAISGLHGIAGEWGHNTMRGEEAPCYCGKKGCIEQVFSGPALEKFYLHQSGHALTLRDIVSQAGLGDCRARETLERLQEKFAEAIAGPINIIDPDAIVIGGGVGNIDLLYTDITRDKITQHIFNNELKTELLRPALGDSAGVFGAALLVR